VQPAGRASSWPILFLAIIGASLVLCGALAVAGVGSSLLLTLTSKGDVASVVDRFMRAMENRDVYRAHALFSPEIQRQLPAARLDTLARGRNRGLFTGYRALEVDSLEVSRSVNTDPTVLQGTLARVRGSITYASGARGTFEGSLQKHAGRWLLRDIKIILPAENLAGGV
jgi:hypothetical protein